MNSKWHLQISFLKSGIRIGGCILAVIENNLIILAVSFLIAELLGIVEELGDNR